MHFVVVSFEKVRQQQLKAHDHAYEHLSLQWLK